MPSSGVSPRGFGLPPGNHFSLAVGDDQFLINAHGYHWSEITASSLILADYDGTIIEGDREVEPTNLRLTSRSVVAVSAA